MKQIIKLRMVKKIGIILIIVGVALFVYAASNFSVKANSDVCDQGEHTHNPHCVTPTPTPTVTPIPTRKPCGEWDEKCITPTPTVSPSPTLTPTPTGTPSATPTPTSTPSTGSSNPPTFAGSSTNAPGVCGDSVPGNVANITVIGTDTNDGKFTVEWSLPSGADKADIRYEEYSQDNWPYSALNVPNTGNFEISDLKNGVNYRVEVAGVNGCAVGNWSAPYDPRP